jgi:DNA-binding transcriptional LysR family regulator
VDRFESLSMLVEAADAGSLSEAGRRLGVPLATVSRKISDLEASLGASLFERSARGLRPTPAGRAYLAAAKSILEQLDEAGRAASGEYSAPRGDLVVAAPVVFGRRHMLPTVIEFLEAYPEVNVELALSDRVARFVDDHVDVALRVGDLADSALTATRLGSVRPVLCASPGYFAAHGAPTTPAALADHAAISFEGVTTLGLWRFHDNGEERTVEARSRLGVNTVEAAIDAAVAGVGLARVMSYQIVDLVRAGALALALETFEQPPLPVSLLFNGQARLPLKLRAFIDFVTPRLRRRLTDAAL